MESKHVFNNVINSLFTLAENQRKAHETLGLLISSVPKEGSRNDMYVSSSEFLRKDLQYTINLISILVKGVFTTAKRLYREDKQAYEPDFIRYIIILIGQNLDVISEKKHEYLAVLQKNPCDFSAVLHYVVFDMYYQNPISFKHDALSFLKSINCDFTDYLLWV